MKKNDFLFILLVTVIYLALFIPVFSELKNNSTFSCPFKRCKSVKPSAAIIKKEDTANPSSDSRIKQNLSSFDEKQIKHFIDKNRLSNREALFYK